MSAGEGIIGAWRLIEMVTRFEDGTVSQPYGPNSDGRLFYTDNGQMAAHLWDPDRHRADHAEAGPRSDPAYFSYTGRWTLDGKTMRHAVDSCTFASWTGITITRDVEWDGDVLVLTANVVFGGKPGVGTLRWRKLQT